MELKYFTNQGEGVYDILLSGVVGQKIDGDQIAAEIKFLNEIGATLIRERINSVGGNIINGMSIIAANIESKAEIHTINEGMAGSIANVILTTGNKRISYDYGLGVIHNPSYNGISLNDMDDGKGKDNAVKFKNSILDIYTNNTSMTRSVASKKMDEDILLSSAEMLELGMIDEIAKSKSKPAITKNMSYVDIMNICNDKSKFIDKPKINKMSDLTKFFNLTDEANETAILKAAQKDRSELKLAKNQISALEKTKGEKDTEINNLKEEVKTFKNQAIESYVNAQIEIGMFLEENKESVIENATKIGLEAFRAIVDGMPKKPANVLNQINNNAGEPKKTTDEKLKEEYQNLCENDSIELKRIKTEEKARFDKMFNAWNK